MHTRESLRGEIRAAATRHDGGDIVGTVGGGDQRGRGPGARAEETDGVRRAVAKPVDGGDQPVREQADVEAMPRRQPVDLLFVRRQQVDEQRADARVV